MTLIYHTAAILLIGTVLSVLFASTYPGVAIDSGVGGLIVLAAIVIEGLLVLLWQRLAGRK